MELESKTQKKERKIEIQERLISEFIPLKMLQDNPQTNTYEFEYTIPRFQRYFVWDIRDIKTLWDSIYRNYPIGSFIIWESDKELPDNREIADNIRFKSSPGDLYKYILDGQQRITSLIVSILGAKKRPMNRKKPIDFTIYLSLKQAQAELKEIDLEKKKKITLFYSEKEKNKLSEEEKKYLVKVSKIIDLDSEIYAKFFREGEEEIATLYQKICHRLKTGYKLSIINLKNIPIEEVCELFTRVNVSGKTLSTIDLITANTFNQDFYLRDYIETLNNELDRINYSELDDLLIIRLVSLIKSYNDEIIKKERGLVCKESDLFEITSGDFILYWKKASDALKESIKFLKEMNISSARIIPYSPMLVSLSFYFYLLGNSPKTEEDINLIKKWFWINSFNGTYQGATNEIISNDASWFERFVRGNKEFNYRLDVALKKPKEFNESNILLDEKLNLSSGFCKAILCLLASKKPRDFTNNDLIDIYSLLIDYKKSELHHIFPKKSEAVSGFSEDRINSIVNICFLPKKSNQTILDDNPSTYFIDKVKKKNPNYIRNLRDQLIPTEERSGIWNDNFSQFLIERAGLIIDSIHDLVK